MALPDLGWMHASVGTLPRVPVVALLAYLVVVAPLLGRRRYMRLRSRRADDPKALLRFHAATTAFQCGLLTVTLVTVLLGPGLRPARLGIRWLTAASVLPAVGWTGYTLAVVLIGAVVMRRRVAQGRSLPGQGAISAMLPRTRTERRAALRVAIGLVSPILVHIAWDIRGFLLVPPPRPMLSSAPDDKGRIPRE
jgi:hypothetical protein